MFSIAHLLKQQALEGDVDKSWESRIGDNATMVRGAVRAV
jgi:hypothetical protein